MSEHLHFPTVASLKATHGTPDHPINQCECGQQITGPDYSGRYETVDGYPGSYTVSITDSTGATWHSGYDRRDPLDKPRARWRTDALVDQRPPH